MDASRFFLLCKACNDRIPRPCRLLGQGHRVYGMRESAAYLSLDEIAVIAWSKTRGGDTAEGWNGAMPAIKKHGPAIRR
jgi:hypothetical protein